MRTIAPAVLEPCCRASPPTAHDIVATSGREVPPATTDGRLATFLLEVSGIAGAARPAATGSATRLRATSAPPGRITKR